MKQYATFQTQGNLVDDPELSFSDDGTARARIRVAHSPRYQQDGEWRDGKRTTVSITVFDRASLKAESVAEHLSKGSAVHVEGVLRESSWTTDDGDTRYGMDFIATDVRPAGLPAQPAS